MMSDSPPPIKDSSPPTAISAAEGFTRVVPIRSPSGDDTEEITLARPAPAGNKPPPVPPTRTMTGFEDDDRERLHTLLTQELPRVVPGLFKGQCPPRVEEALQQWVVRVLSHPPAVRVENLQVLLRSVIRNANTDGHRMKCRHVKGREQLLAAEHARQHARRIRVPVEDEELSALVQAALADLPDHYRALIVRHYFDDEPIRSIALSLGVHWSSVARSLGRINVLLRHKLARVAAEWM